MSRSLPLYCGLRSTLLCQRMPSGDWLPTGETAVCAALPPKPLQNATLGSERSSSSSRRKRRRGCGLTVRRDDLRCEKMSPGDMVEPPWRKGESRKRKGFYAGAERDARNISERLNEPERASRRAPQNDPACNAHFLFWPPALDSPWAGHKLLANRK